MGPPWQKFKNHWVNKKTECKKQIQTIKTVSLWKEGLNYPNYSSPAEL